jgi:fructoselysine-6-P-deglycase FrlB-like protein
MTADRVEAFEADIAAGPDALARLLDGWVPIGLGGRRRIALTGLGSSRFAALIVASALRARGVDAWAEYASTSAATRPSRDLALIAISASGRTREVVDAAARHQGTSLVVAVTNDAGSRLADGADIVVPLLAGEEPSGIACRTFRATVAALAVMTGLADTSELRPSVEALAASYAGREAWLPLIADGLDGAPSIDVLADAALLGVAEQAALMLREAPRLPARAWDTGDWLHTGVYLALPGHRALLFGGSRADAEVIGTVTRRGGAVIHAGGPGAGAGPPIPRVLVGSLVGELVAAALWRRTWADDKRP